MRRLLSAIVGAAFVFGAASASAATLSARDSLTDAQFNQLIADGDFTEEFIAESRGGTAGLGGDKEIEILDPVLGGPGGPPIAGSQFLWTDGTSYDFKLTFDGTTVTYIVDGTTLSATPSLLGGTIDTIFLRTRSHGDGSMTELFDLAFDGTAFGQGLISQDGDTVDYAVITGFSGAFELTGKQRFSWGGPGVDPITTIPQRARLAYQIKVGTGATPVPIPASLGLMLAGMAGLAWVVRRRREV